MFPVAAIAGAGWLCLFVVLLMAPEGRSAELDAPGEAPPAVISLLIGRLERLGFGATLVDLAARGWFQVRAPGGPPAPGPGSRDGAWEPAGPAMCVVCAESPAGPLAPFERRVLAHVALRAGALGEVPAPALSDGFEGGEDAFMKAFREEVDAEARHRGLTRARLSGRRIGLLCLLAFIPAGALLIAFAGHRSYPVAWAAGCYVVLGVVAIGTGTSRRRSAAGQAAVRKWRSAVAAPGEARLLAYAAALELAPAALAVFAPSTTNMAWSSYRGSWQQLEIETNSGPWLRSCLILLAIMIAPIAYVGGAIWLGTHGEAGLAEDMAGLVAAGAVACVVALLARRMLARFAEFDGQVIRQWMVTGDSDTPDQYHIAVDDGTRAKAWDLAIGSEPWRLLPPGTFVHVRVNLDHRDQVTVHPVEPPAVARPLENIAAEQQRAATGGLPDPAGLLTADEAAAVLGGPARGKHADGTSGRTMIWQPARTATPLLRVEVRQAGTMRPVPPTARPVPGVTDGYLLGQAAMVTAPPLTAVISVSGRAPAAAEAALAGLLPLVDARLRDLAARGAGPDGQGP